jgi:cysteine desulfurase family protein (TIGR01976 family)
MLNLSEIRSQFPSLSVCDGGRPLAYLDAPGGTQVPQRVIDAISGYLATSNSNVHGPFLTSRRTDAVVREAHQAMADFLGCENDEVVFGPNMTTLTFAFSRALMREWKAGDEVVTTLLDHDANVAPWRALEEQGIVVHRVDIDPRNCTLNMDDFRAKLSARTRLVAVGYASNAVGTINPVEEVVRLAREHGALSYVDAVHYAPHRSIDVAKLGCDFLACSVYKFFGPHIGVVYGKREHLRRLSPYKVRPATEELPYRWETGTQNHECLAGVAAAVDYVASLAPLGTNGRREAIKKAFAAISMHEAKLCTHLLQGLQAIRGLTLYGIPEVSRLNERTATVGIHLTAGTPAQIAKALGKRGICTWNGNFYALSLTERLGLEDSGGLLRIGLVHYNTVEEVDRLLEELSSLAQNHS